MYAKIKIQNPIHLGQRAAFPLGGGGTVANGNVTAGTLSFPAGMATNGTLTLTGRLTLGANARVAVTGVDNSFPQKTFVLLNAAGGIDGTVAGLDGFEDTEHPSLWQVTKDGNTLRLFYCSGTQILIR